MAPKNVCSRMWRLPLARPQNSQLIDGTESHPMKTVAQRSSAKHKSNRAAKLHQLCTKIGCKISRWGRGLPGRQQVSSPEQAKTAAFSPWAQEGQKGVSRGQARGSQFAERIEIERPTRQLQNLGFRPQASEVRHGMIRPKRIVGGIGAMHRQSKPGATPASIAKPAAANDDWRTAPSHEWHGVRAESK